MYPSPRQGSPRQRIARASRNLALFAKLSPEFAAIHPIETVLPQECIALMSHSFLSDEFDTMFEIPGYARWLEQQDFTVQRVYAQFGLELTPEAEQRMLAFARERQHRSNSPHAYSTDNLRFNAEETDVFADYCARHCVCEPTPSG